MTEAPLRRATQQDVDVLFELQKSTALVAYAHIFPEAHAFPDDQVRSEWDAFLRDMGAQVAIAEAEGAPVGTVAVLPPALERLFVIPRYWGAGIGELLHRWAIATLRDARCQRAELVVLEANTRARNFYERRGWQIEGPPQSSVFPPYPATLRYVRSLSG